MAWDGTLSLEFLAAGAAVPLPEFTGSGAALVAGTPPLQELRVFQGLAGSVTHLVTDPDTLGNSIAAVRIDAALGSGTLSPLPPHPFGTRLDSAALPVAGAIRFCFLTATCTDAATLLDFAQGSRAIGLGGTLTGATPSGARLSIQAAPWTLGTATVPVATTGGGTVTAFAFGWLHGPLSFTGSTTATGAHLQLVTPMVAASPAAQSLAGFGRLGIRFVPEPGRAVLLLAAVCALLVLARRRIAP